MISKYRTQILKRSFQLAESDQLVVAASDGTVIDVNLVFVFGLPVGTFGSKESWGSA